MNTASPDTLLLTNCKLLTAHVRKVLYIYFAPKDFPLNTGPFYQCVKIIPTRKCHYRPTRMVKFAVSKETGVRLCPDDVGCWRGVLVSTLANERVCNREKIELLLIADLAPTLKSPMGGVWRRVNIVRFISRICVVFLGCSGLFSLRKLSRCGLRGRCQGGGNIGMVRIIHQKCNPSITSFSMNSGHEGDGSQRPLQANRDG